MESAPRLKELRWVANCHGDLKQFPVEVQHAVGYALYLAQAGGKYRNAKVLKHFGGASVLEIIEDYDGSTYRAVYTLRFDDVVYVLHAFQKKSKRGIATPKAETDLIKKRLVRAADDYALRKAQEGRSS